MSPAETFGEAMARLEADVARLPAPMRWYLSWKLRRVRRHQARLRDRALRGMGLVP